jgi:hypothetical protein
MLLRCEKITAVAALYEFKDQNTVLLQFRVQRNF